ncbi:MAG TPA: hypothetical protein VIH26_02990 [Anaerolineales bacterium]
MEERKGRAGKRRIAFTIVTTIAWLVFTLYWVGFLWPIFYVRQSIASLCIVSVLFAGFNALVWTLWPSNRE